MRHARELCRLYQNFISTLAETTTFLMINNFYSSLMIKFALNKKAEIGQLVEHQFPKLKAVDKKI